MQPIAKIPPKTVSSDGDAKIGAEIILAPN
jgi:hypothetical protein